MTVDPRTFRLAVTFLGISLLACIAGIVTLSALHDSIPDVLATIAGVVGGALAGLFVTPHSGEPTPVSVVDQPVAVTDAPAKKTTRRRRRDAGLTGVGLIVLVLVVLLLASVLGTAVHPLFWLILVLLVLAVLL